MKDWEAECSDGVSLSQGEDGLWHFEFPTKDGVRYITRPYSGLTPRRVLFEMNVTKSRGGPAFVSPDGEQPLVRLYFCNGDWQSGDGQWWSNPAHLDLVFEKQSIAVTVAPAYWSNVDGRSGMDREQQFLSCSKHVTRVGFALGKGVYVAGGNARCTFKHKVIA